MHNKIKIDINADLGEGMSNDAQIMPLISSCNIACGGHVGNEMTILKSLKLAKKHNVKVGAHPSFPDKDNFGRALITMTKKELTRSIYEQIMLFYNCCDQLKMKMHHVKLHGALYNYAAKDAPTADAVVEAILETGERPVLYVPPNSVLAEKAKNLLPIKYEAFIDRAYNEDLSLVSRKENGALIQNKKIALNQLLNIVIDQSVNTVIGVEVSLKASTFCIHGDQKNAVEILKFIIDDLPQNNIIVS
ncbi:UPF0271 protein [Patiriisocius marinistellae]|uniref:UPF0271 protein n=1 Tax=Patiriisocius marinistellae TaxID=2494560 RepID=A0A5J4G0V7_9FLAO|nr:5-oxoprolinase subunit PxpA [Patiriisocius marinistellae]GEQ86179.1 UPF0271 protein [Patiriisocius marinistellae]